MVKCIVVTTHGDFCKGIVDSYDMIAGKSESIHTISLKEDIEEFSTSLSELVSNLLVNYEEILILCDLKGGTPYNESMRQYLTHPEKIKLVSGLNLPMLIEVSLQLQTLSLSELAALAIESGQVAISN